MLGILDVGGDLRPVHPAALRLAGIVQHRWRSASVRLRPARRARSRRRNPAPDSRRRSRPSASASFSRAITPLASGGQRAGCGPHRRVVARGVELLDRGALGLAVEEFRPTWRRTSRAACRPPAGRRPATVLAVFTGSLAGSAPALWRLRFSGILGGGRCSCGALAVRLGAAARVRPRPWPWSRRRAGGVTAVSILKSPIEGGGRLAGSGIGTPASIARSAGLRSGADWARAEPADSVTGRSPRRRSARGRIRGGLASHLAFRTPWMKLPDHGNSLAIPNLSLKRGQGASQVSIHQTITRRQQLARRPLTTN